MMKKGLKSWIFPAFLLFAGACTKPSPDDSTPDYMQVSWGDEELKFESIGGERVISITALQNWLVSVSGEENEVEWCRISPSAGLAGSAQLTLTVDSYQGESERMCVLTFVCANQKEEVEVRQSGTDGDAFVYFSDPEFKKMILDEYDSDQDGKLSSEEALQVVRLDFHSTDISSLKGIERMDNLEYLDCSFNKISGELNLGNLKKLRVAQLHHNLYSSLDVSGCSALDTLIANDNYTYDDAGYMVFLLEEVNLGGCTSLRKADFTDNNLTSLDCSDCVGLTDLNCRYNKLSSLDISTCDRLVRLSCRTNAGLSGELDLSHCPDLEYLECYETAYEKLNTSGCSRLKYVYAHNSSLSEVDFSSNIALVHLDIYNNKIPALNVRNNTALSYLDASLNRIQEIDLSRNMELAELSLGYNSIGELDLSGHDKLVKLSASSNALTKIDVSGCQRLENLNIDDNQLRSLDLSSNEVLGVLSANDNAIQVLDLSHNPLIRVANCERNSLATCNTDGCAELLMLCVESNELSSLDLSTNKSLSELYAAKNNLAKVDLAGLSLLSICELYDNRLERIKLDGCTSISELYLHNNKLAYLSTWDCEAMRQLDCRNNLLKSLDLSNNISMSFLFATENPLMTVVYINEKSDYNTISVDENVEVLYRTPGDFDDVSGDWGDDDIDPWK